MQPGDFPQWFVIAGPHQSALARTGAAEPAFELQLRHHTRAYPIRIGIFTLSRIEVIGAGADNHGADRDRKIACRLVGAEKGSNQGHDFIGVKRFDQIVQSALLHGLHGGFHRGVGSHHHHGQLRPNRFGLLQQLHAIHGGHLDIGQHQIVG